MNGSAAGGPKSSNKTQQHVFNWHQNQWWFKTFHWWPNQLKWLDLFSFLVLQIWTSVLWLLLYLILNLCFYLVVLCSTLSFTLSKNWIFIISVHVDGKLGPVWTEPVVFQQFPVRTWASVVLLQPTDDFRISAAGNLVFPVWTHKRDQNKGGFRPVDGNRKRIHPGWIKRFLFIYSEAAVHANKKKPGE